MRTIAIVVLSVVALILGMVVGSVVSRQNVEAYNESSAEVGESEGHAGLAFGNENYAVLVYYDNPGFSVVALDFNAVGNYPTARSIYFENMEQLRSAWQKAMVKQATVGNAQTEIPFIPAEDSEGVVDRTEN